MWILIVLAKLHHCELDWKNKLKLDSEAIKAERVLKVF
jgi:hypothetical protein